MATKNLITVDEFFKLAPNLDHCELVRGEIVEMSPPGLIHGKIAMRLGAFEFVTLTSGNIRVLTYRIQWQTAKGQLKKRWDNAEHHSEIATFPHYVHVGVSGEVRPSEAMSIQKALEVIEERLRNDR